MGDENSREHHRVTIPGVSNDTEVYVTIGAGMLKQKVLDLSDGGVCFVSNRYLPLGENTQIHIHFPWLNESIEVTARVVRSTEIKDGDDASDDANKKTSYGIAGRFVALTMGQEDKLFREVRKLERKLIAEAKDSI